MTLLQLIRIVEFVALKQPAVKSVVENDVFRLSSLPNAKYGVFAWLQGTHAGNVEDSLQTFSFTFFYVDRLRTDGKNELEVQSVGVEVLQNVLKTLADVYEVEVEDYTITTFNQRFADVCAGAFATVRLNVPVGSLCADEFQADFSLDFSDDFWTLIL